MLQQGTVHTAKSATVRITKNYEKKYILAYLDILSHYKTLRRVLKIRNNVFFRNGDPKLGTFCIKTSLRVYKKQRQKLVIVEGHLNCFRLLMLKTAIHPI